MRYYPGDRIPTLAAALNEHMNASDLRKLAALTGEKLPVRKAELAAVVMRYLEGDRLHAVWRSLDEFQRAAVAEQGYSYQVVVHDR